MQGKQGARPMVKHIVILFTTFAILVSTYPAAAQQAGKVYRIGFLTAGSVKSLKKRLGAFRDGMRTLGYIEGKNLIIEERYAKGRRKQIPALAAQLVGLNVEVIVTNGGTSTLAADRAAKMGGEVIPVVFALAADPVGTGLVASLSRPGGNITGLSNFHTTLVPKRFELIKEVVSTAKRVAVLWGPRTKNGAPQLKVLQAVAPRLGVTLLPVPLNKSDDVDRAFADMRSARADALTVFAWSLSGRLRKQIAKAAIKYRLPTIHSTPRNVAVGGLMAYGANPVALYRRAATYVDKILKGANPAELPIYQATKFNLTVNLKTAKALGITFPPSILLRANKVIE